MPFINSTVGRLLKASAIALGMFGGAVATQAIIGADMFVAKARAETHRIMKLAMDKSAVLRLPAGVKDVLVGNPEVADVVLRSKRTMYIFARKLGSTNIFLLDANGRPITRLDLSVVINPSVLQRLLKKALPEADIRVEPMDTQLLLTGTARSPAQVNKALQIAKNFVRTIGTNRVANTGGGTRNIIGLLQVVNAIKITGKDQVMIKMKLAEVSRTTIKQLRTSFDSINFQKGDLRGVMGFLFPFSLGNSLGNYGANLSYTGKNVQSDFILRAMERDGLMRVLAEPTLTAISGEVAKFMAGAEVPVVSGCDLDNGAINCAYEYKPIGVIVGFTPVVLSERRISLKLSIESSDVSNKYSLSTLGGNVVPGIQKRRAETTVELPSGGTLAIAGVITETTKHNIDGVPGLKNLPILGALFRSREFQSEQTELVMLATPYIVSPRNEKQFRTPADKLQFASDYQSYFLGRLHRVYGAPSGPKGGQKVYHGNVGFILE